MDLIRKSALQASAKLQFARLAFGAAGSREYPNLAARCFSSATRSAPH